ncbi:hypothetical protein FA10DRAFT_270185 [Acaromyces ingoldii]|uniref:Uncharacterized protein n=1 Tax=Acaromyces ingoldii TaxID=215250 RepID=A0A316YAX1_9BASI|nr:hypothetical protein FA10DRAFT_270185 [Acaromyces ingoldii]PWN86492.1 hypothetical protein FA10DRAFT_270185 [Acaromyces ingoldii]
MLRISFASTFVALALATRAKSCFDPGQNVCARGTQQCTKEDARYTFNDGTPIGIQSGVLLHSDLTKGCYCQFAHVTFYSGDDPLSFKKPKANDTIVTSCSNNYDAWWDGAQVMNTTGGSLGGETFDDSYTSSEYDTMACASGLELIDSEAPSVKSHLLLIEWPSVSQAIFEAPIPSGVGIFEDGDCPGYDSGEGFGQFWCCHRLCWHEICDYL